MSGKKRQKRGILKNNLEQMKGIVRKLGKPYNLSVTVTRIETESHWS